MITHDEILKAVARTASVYPIKRASYFGSYANGEATGESDLDLLVEFNKPAVSLFVLLAVKIDLEDQLKIPVDIIHAPMPKESLIEIKKAVPVYG